MPIQLRKKGLATKLAQQIFGTKQEQYENQNKETTVPWKPQEDSFEQAYRQLASWRQRR